MSIPLLRQHLASIRHDARRLVQRARDHEHDLDGLVRTAERAARHATALSEALGDGAISAIELRGLCSDQLGESVENATAAHRACVSAREQHIATHRLLTRIDDEYGAEEPLAPGRATAVLVVDDVADIRDLVALVLRDAGFVVRTAVNGLDALLAAHEMKPSVIVMDLTMPVLDGLEATRLIKATEELREAKVIAYTGNTSIPEVFVERWFTAIVPKPSPPHVVLAAVQNAAGR